MKKEIIDFFLLLLLKNKLKITHKYLFLKY
jgi:hypothetical protein